MRSPSLVPIAADRATRLQVLIADDHALVRNGLTALVDQEPGFQVVGAAADGEEAVTMTERLRPDVLLLDVSMPRLDGLGVLRRLAEKQIQVRTVLLSADVEHETETQALALGARGLILKEAAADVLFQCLRAVATGHYWVRCGAAGDLQRAIESVAQEQPDPGRFGLTDRELQITRLVVAGYSNGEIAAHYGLSTDTVTLDVSNIFNKARVSSRAELAQFVSAHRLVEQPVASH